MRSIALKLSLAFLCVGLIGVILVALFVGQRTRREFDQFVSDRYQHVLADTFLDYYATQGNWNGVERLFRRNRRGGTDGPGPAGPPVTLVNVDGTILLSGKKGQVGRSMPRVAQDGLPLEVDDELVGWLVFDPPPVGFDRGTPEWDFIMRVNRAILYGAGGAVIVALVIGLIFARTLSRPLRELTNATQVVAKGELGHQVTVRSKDEIGQLATSFNQMSTDLAQANQLRRQMTADIAHDLRTPLSVILGYTEALDEGKLQGEPEIYEVLHSQSRHLSRLIDDLRTFALADAGELPLHRIPVSPRSLLEKTAAAHRPHAEAQQVELRVEADPNLPEINVDLDRMISQVLGNLVNNALRYTPLEGTVILAARRGGDQILLEVQDTGSGMDAADVPHIFDRFYRSDKSRQQNGEAGLGLPIVRSIVQAHGGEITVTSEPDVGTTFTIRLAIQSM